MVFGNTGVKSNALVILETRNIFTKDDSLQLEGTTQNLSSTRATVASRRENNVAYKRLKVDG